MLFVAGIPGRTLAEQEVGQTVFSDDGATIGPISVATGELIEVEITTSVDQGWAAFALDLLPEDESQNGAAVSLETSYYSGVEDGESWSEGSRTDSIVLKHEGPAGDFMLQVVGEFGSGETLVSSEDDLIMELLQAESGDVESAIATSRQPSVRVVVKVGVWLQRYFGTTFGFSFFFLVGLLIHRGVFERLRGTGESWSSS
jgi:hypothetical protein